MAATDYVLHAEWKEFNRLIMDMDEKQCWLALELELATEKPRTSRLDRLFSRANTLRAMRQRGALLHEKKLVGDRP